MTVTVAKSTIFENIYKNFYDRLNAVGTLSGKIYPSDHDIDFTSESDYPVNILDSPRIENDSFTFGKGMVEGTIAFHIYTTTPKDTDLYASDATDAIETSKGTLAGVKLREVHLDSTESDNASFGEMRVYVKTLNFRYKFYYTKTRAF